MKNLDSKETGQIAELCQILKKKHGFSFDSGFDVRPTTRNSVFSGKFFSPGLVSVRVENKEVELCLEKVGYVWFFGIVVSIYDPMRPQIQSSRNWSLKLSLNSVGLDNIIFGAKTNFGETAMACTEFGRICDAVQEFRKAIMKASQIIDQKV